MKRAILVLMLCLSSLCFADYLGSWKIGDYVTITATTHQFSTGNAYAATGNVTYSIYEDSNATQLIDANAMPTFDSITGLYLGRQQLTTALGFERSKHYTVLVKATVDSVSAITTHTFQINAAVDVNTVGEEVPITDDRFDDLDSALAAAQGDITALQGDIATILGWSDGSGFTDMPWNAAWTTEVTAAANDALQSRGYTSTVSGRIDMKISDTAFDANSILDNVMAGHKTTGTFGGTLWAIWQKVILLR